MAREELIEHKTATSVHDGMAATIREQAARIAELEAIQSAYLKISDYAAIRAAFGVKSFLVSDVVAAAVEAPARIQKLEQQAADAARDGVSDNTCDNILDATEGYWDDKTTRRKTWELIRAAIEGRDE